MPLINNETNNERITRRHALHLGGMALFVLAAGSDTEQALAGEPAVKVGLITDVHYADADTRGTRHYRESLGKMREAASGLAREKVDLAVALGDIVDTPSPPDTEKEVGFLKTITAEFARVGAPCHYVLGNHCVSGLTKRRFLGTVEQRRSWYSFDRGGVHFVILDACHSKDGTPYRPGSFEWTDTDIPVAQRQWLEADLQATRNKAVIFVHQRLDEPVNQDYRIHTAPAVRKVLEQSGKVLAVFQGHSHKNELQTIGNIPYCTLAAMVEGSGPENSGFSVLRVYPDATVALTGWRRHADHPFSRGTKSAA